MNATRRTGIDVVGDAPWGTHFCQLYRTGEDLKDVLVPYFKAGLEQDEHCMWVTSEPLGVREAWSALAGAVPDLDGYRRRGRIEIIPYTEWYLEGGTFDPDRVLRGWVERLEGALAAGCQGLRLSGNTFWLESSRWRAFTDYEAAIDSIIGKYAMLALCTYSLERCGASEVIDVVANHEFGLIKRGGAWEIIESQGRRWKREAEERRRIAQDARSQAEAALAKVREADRRKDEFLAVLSHELRNPLMPIRNSLYVLGRSAPGSEPSRRAQAVIERQVNHLTRLVDDLLDVTRIARGKTTLRREPVELGGLVRRTVEDLRGTLDEAGLVVEARFTAEPLWARADPTRVAQILGNLLQNAAMFTPSGGRVWVTLDEERGEAVLRVRDTGAGIAGDMLARVFEPFAQEARTAARGRGGLGLGLALVKGLVELHGGTVAVASDGPDRGAELTVRLPLDAASADAGEPGGIATSARRRRVLVIEDDADTADSLREVLEIMGHEVAVANDGASGIGAAREFRPEVVLCDIGLPGMDGHEVARRLRGDPSSGSAMLVALTGLARDEDRRRAADSGFSHHLAKPTTVEALEELLR